MALPSICFILFHGGPAAHLATFADSLSKDGTKVEIFASEVAKSQFNKQGIQIEADHLYNIEGISSEEEKNRIAQEIAAKASISAQLVITDLGHPFVIKLQTALKEYHIERLVYYDNFEPFVPGGYSETAAKIIPLVDGILFANRHLAKSPIYQKIGEEIAFGGKKNGIGYYPIEQGDQLAKRRENEHVSLRQTLVENKKEWTVLGYLGGNNEVYFKEAFPAFLKLIDQAIQQNDLSQVMIVFQQHGGARRENRDGSLLLEGISRWKDNAKAPRIIMSPFSNSDDLIVAADQMFYFQTSMAPLCLLAGLPTRQIGHEPFQDVLVRNQWIPSVTDADKFVEVIHDKTGQQPIPKETILDGLGYDANWFANLKQALAQAE